MARHLRCRGLRLAVVLLLLAACGGVPQATGFADYDAISAEDITNYRDKLAKLAAEYRIEHPPSYEIVRWVTNDEIGRVTYQCLTEQGIQATLEDDGSIGFINVDWESDNPVTQAMYACAARYPLHPKYTRPLTATQVDAAYTYFVETLVPCLRKNGWEIADIPSRETFKAGYGQGKDWSPWVELMKLGATSEQVAQLVASCPGIGEAQLYPPASP